jgi:glycosyltransferase involved in cell wall biosynthesis
MTASFFEAAHASSPATRCAESDVVLETGGEGHIAFFHQNDVFETLGGIERYVWTLCDSADQRAVFVGPAIAPGKTQSFAIEPAGPAGAPRWLRYTLGLLRQRRKLATFLQANGVRVLEFSRPEYLLAGASLPGKRVVTIHGTGPGPGNRGHWFVHHAACFLLPFFADRVQIVGRDPSGLPRLVRAMLGKRVVHVDAWHDDGFTPAPLPSLDVSTPLRVFYAGRMAPQKNPKLLFEIVRTATATAPGAFEFHYFGGDYDAFERAGVATLVENHGFLKPQALAEAIRSCHLGLMCSAFGEGSPYIVVEALGCGRPYVVPSLPTLLGAYRGFAGARFVETCRVEAYVAAMLAVRNDMLAGRIDPRAIAAELEPRARARAVPELLDALAGLAGPTKSSV